MSLIALIESVSSETGPFAAAFGVALTGTLFTAGSGVGVIEPTTAETFSESAEVQRVFAANVTVSNAAIVDVPMDKTVVHDGRTYKIREVVTKDEGMTTFRAVARIATETGRRAKE